MNRTRIYLDENQEGGLTKRAESGAYRLSIDKKLFMRPCHVPWRCRGPGGGRAYRGAPSRSGCRMGFWIVGLVSSCEPVRSPARMGTTTRPRSTLRPTIVWAACWGTP